MKPKPKKRPELKRLTPLEEFCRVMATILDTKESRVRRLFGVEPAKKRITRSRRASATGCRSTSGRRR